MKKDEYKEYNIAKRARDWAYNTRLLKSGAQGTVHGPVEAWLIMRKRLSEAVGRLMREAYQKGFESGYNESRGEGNAVNR